MTIRRIAQPYIVDIPWTDDKEHEMLHWLAGNMVHYYYLVFVANGGLIIPDTPGVGAGTSEILKSVCWFHFEDAKDALLFKLTWSGN